MKLPWIKFFSSDWLSDEALRSCSIAARGMWIDLLAMMAKSNTHGFLLVGDVPASVEQIARIVGEPTDVTRKLLQELERNGVFSRDENNVVYSRRMKRDEDSRKSNAVRQMRYKEAHKEDDSPKVTKYFKPSKFEWMEYAKTIAGWNDAESAYDYYESIDWKAGGGREITDWKAVARNCARRSEKKQNSVEVKFGSFKPAPREAKSACESPKLQPINYNSVDVVADLVTTALKEGLSLTMLKASAPKDIWEKAFEMAKAKESLCPA